jgi:tetratricopeptide (TPR) repeat protein
VIHAFDDPVHAPLGLPAARAYSRIAPDAAHAQHMTTHIFLALGMWDDVVAQNTIAARLTNWRSGHYVSWHHYGLLQQGRFREAAEALRAARERWGSAAGMAGAALALMRAQQVVTTEGWDDPSLAWSIPLGAGMTTPRAIDEFGQGYAALRRGDRAGAASHHSRLAELAAAAVSGGSTPNARAVPGIMARELEAALLLADGKADQAIAALRQAAEEEAALPLEFGPPEIVKPSFELLGEALLAQGRAAEAVRAFTRALELAPGRVLSLRGLARAAEQAGDRALADRTRDRLARVFPR